MLKVASKLIPYYDQLGFDGLVCDESCGIFCIFDGMGTSEDARIASGEAVNYFENLPGVSWHFEILRHCLDNISAQLKQMNLSTGTTATVVHVDRVGYLHYAHVGDSRLYVLNDNRVKQVTADEGVENILYNYLGKYGVGVCQLGMIEPEKWDKFMLCSDGITGDREPDLMDDKTVEHNLKQDVDPEKICEYFLTLSSKKDDKSIIVVVKE